MPLQNCRTTLYRYDALSRLIETIDAEAGVTAYGYDGRDNLVTVTDANGNTHSFTYDRVGQVKTEARPMGATIAYAYDAAGNLIQRTSPNGERRQYDYDAAGRKVTERHYPKDDETSSQTVMYVHDARNALTSYTQSGDTHSAADYVYDAVGQKTDETVTYGHGDAAFSHTMATSYRPNGQKASFTYPDGTTVDYSYTANGLLQSTTLPGGGSITWQTYAWQQPTKVVMPGAVRTFEYDALQRPTRIKSQAIGAGTADNPQGELIMDYRYTFDAAGNITTRDTEDGPYTYTYDKIDRLLTATPPPSLQQTPDNPEPDKLPVEAYTYDPVHNRLSSQHQPGPWTYNADNQLLSYGTGPDLHTFTYTPNGHTATELTGDPESPTNTREFRYNAAERLTEVKDNEQTIGQYHYDPMGRRIRKHTNEGTTWFLYADEGLIAELTAVGEPNRYYGRRPGGIWGTDPLWQALQADDAWGLHIYQNDHLRTPVRTSFPSGEISWAGRAQAFGATYEPIGTPTNQLRFPGHFHDKETDYHQNYHRDYNTQRGTYLQADPIGLNGGINIYSYATQSPNSISDPYGLVNWRGTMVGASLISGYGAGFYFFDLKSECVGGKMATARVFASSVALGMGAKLTGGGGSVELYDWNDVPTPDVFNSGFGLLSAGIATGGGAGCSKIRLGLAFSKAACGGPVYGFDFSAGAYIGRSVVTSSRVWDCGVCDE